MRVTARELASLVNGVIIGDADAPVTSFAIDTRVLEPGACFVALQGQRDGHDYVGDAFARGARVAVVARALEHSLGTALVVVHDPLAALASVATQLRARWSGTIVVGVTGSAGKTATKDLTAAALSGRKRVHASPGSFNNEAGLPLTLLGAPADVDVVVAEMGARFPGNIADLCEIARPQVGVVTHVGLAHAGLLGGPEGVLRTKGELVEALPLEGVAVLNADDEATPRLAARTRADVLTAGTSAGADVAVRGLMVDRELRPRFTLESPWGRADVALSVRGAHQALNAALAAGVALWIGVDIGTVAAGLADATTAEWRMDLVCSPAGITVLNDAYNASPSSMAAAVRSLGHLSVPGRRVAVLGDMLELGEHSEAEHAALGKLAAEAGVDIVVAIGRESRATAARAREAGLTVVTAEHADEVVPWLAVHLQAGDAVLVKASRAVGLEVVAHALTRGELEH